MPASLERPLRKAASAVEEAPSKSVGVIIADTSRSDSRTFAFPAFVDPLRSKAELMNDNPPEARVIAKEAYIYGFPLVDNYRIQYASFVDSADPQFKAPWNHLDNIGRVYGPADTTIQTPNSDTPYSHLGADLRREPIVITVPAMETNRYFCVQLIDAYTFNFDYIGTRSTGNSGGVFLIAGPNWNGAVPDGITKVFHSETAGEPARGESSRPLLAQFAHVAAI